MCDDKVKDKENDKRERIKILVNEKRNNEKYKSDK